MDNLIFASTHRDQMCLWMKVLAPYYPLIFSNNIESVFSTEKQNTDNGLLVLDARLINESYQLPLLCKYVNKVIIVGESFTPSQQIQFILEGACGYSDKSINKQLILRTIKGVLNNEIWLKRQFMPQMLKKIAAKQSVAENQQQFNDKAFKTISVLTEREIEVVEHVYSGKDNLSIAEQLNISNRTVKAHMSAILSKLNVQDRFHLVVLLKDLQISNMMIPENGYNN